MWFLLACQAPLTVDSVKGTVVHDSSTDSQHDSVETIPGDSGTTTTTTTTVPDTDTAPPPPPPDPDVIVDCNGGADFSTIAAAIAASPSGTRIGLRPCTYKENVDYLGKSLVIFGIDGPATTILQGAGSGSVVSVVRGESVGTELSRVTITGGKRSGDYGSAIRVENAIFRGSELEITGNNNGYSVIYGFGVSMELIDVNMHDNRVDRGGGAIILDNGSMVGQRLQVNCSGVDYGIYTHNSTLVLQSEIICGDSAGVAVEGGEFHARQSRIESSGIAVYGEDNADTRNERLWLFNSALIGGSQAVYAAYMHIKAENDVFWADRVGIEIAYGHTESYIRNSFAGGSSCGIKGDGYAYELLWNAQTNTSAACHAEIGGGLIGEPGFKNAPADFHLKKGSLLIDAGTPDKDKEDLDGSRNDVGMYGGPSGGW